MAFHADLRFILHLFMGWMAVRRRKRVGGNRIALPAQTIMPLIRPCFRARHQHYSHLKATRGSTLVARCAGSKAGEEPDSRE